MSKTTTVLRHALKKAAVALLLVLALPASWAAAAYTGVGSLDQILSTIISGPPTVGVPTRIVASPNNPNTWGFASLGNEVASLLYGEASWTEVLLQTSAFGTSPWGLLDATRTAAGSGITDVFGGSSVWTVTGTAANGNLYQSITVPNDSSSWTLACYIYPGAYTQTDVKLSLTFTGGTSAAGYAIVNLSVSPPKLSNIGVVIASSIAAVPGQSAYRVSLTVANNSSGNTTLSARLAPSLGSASESMNFSHCNLSNDAGGHTYVNATSSEVTTTAGLNPFSLPLDLTSIGINGSNALTCLSMTTSTLGCGKAIAPVVHEWVSYIDNNGLPHLAQPACGDLSDSIAACNTKPARYDSGTGVISPNAFGSLTVFEMAGLSSGKSLITPATSGEVLVNIYATLNSTSGTAGVGISCEIYYGSGNGPGNAASVTGTRATGPVTYTNPSAATSTSDINIPFSLSANLSLSVGTAYWLDLACESEGTPAQFSLANVHISASEQ